MKRPLRSRRHVRESGLMRLWSLAAMLTLIAALGVVAQGVPQITPAQSAPTNFDFRAGDIGSAPPGWLTPAAATNFVARLADDGPASGGRSVVIRYEGKGLADEGVANFRQRIVGTTYRNKVVRFRAAVRAEPGVEAHLYVMVERPGGQPGFRDLGVAITGAAWTTHEILGGISPDAETLIVGIFVTGAGAAAIAEASLEVVGAVDESPIGERSRPLSARQLENLTAFARVWGLVRYFHPSDQAAKADWDALAVAGIAVAEAARDAGELASVLEAFFRPVAPTLRVLPANRPAPPRATQPPAGTGARKQISWKNIGYRTGERIPADVPPGALLPEPYVAELGGGVRALVPLSLFVDDRGTLPHVPQPTRTWRTYDADSRAVRLGGVVIAWNVLQYFYPYFDVVKTDWSQVLPAALLSAAADADGRQFRTTLLGLVAALHDGHGAVRPWVREARLPISVTWVDGDLIVTHVDGATGQALARGDAIVTIDGRPVAEWRRALEGLLSSATPQWFQIKCSDELIWGAAGERVNLSVEPFNARGTLRSVTLERQKATLKAPGADVAARPEPVAELRAGVVYVDLTRLKNLEEWRAALPKLEAAAAVILDVRGYPNISQEFLRNLFETPFTSAQFRTLTITRPDDSDRTFSNGFWDMKPLAPYIGARKIFLTDARAYSYAESVMGIIEHYRVGDIVGGPTAGTNGNVYTTALPGDYQINWTGLQVLKHDGSQHHGVGILPTVPASRTRAGIAAGRDEVLERALGLLESPPAV